MHLVRYEAARTALQVAHSVDEVKDIRDKAQAMAAYARQAKDTQLVEWATEIKVRAERRAGEILAQLERKNGEKGAEGILSTLEKIEIPVVTAHRWQKLAAIPEDRFEQAVVAAKEVAGEVTTAAMLRASQGPHVTHNSGENEWYTPPEYLELARKAMGGIDCDPASSELANSIVKASAYFTAQEDGLSKVWRGRVWMNPPYSQPLCAQFCEALLRKFSHKEIEQACVLVNNATETSWLQPMLRAASAICFVTGRIKYLDRSGKPANTPLQGQVILYFGAREREFLIAAEHIGVVLRHV